MQLRPLGRSGLQIAPIVFGGNVFGWTADEKRSFELLDAFVDAGFNAIDTADVYSRWVPGHQGGESETLIGRWLKANPARRQQVLLFTKVGSDMGDEHKGLGKLLNTSTSASGKGEWVTCQMSKLSTSCSIQRATSDRPPTHQRVRKSASWRTAKTGARLCGCTVAAFE